MSIVVAVAQVVPLVGTWIEIMERQHLQSALLVVPLVGTWIEIWEE